MLWDSTSVRTTSMPDRIAESNANALRLCCHHRIMGWNPFWMDVFAKLHYNHKKFLQFFPLLHMYLNLVKTIGAWNSEGSFRKYFDTDTFVRQKGEPGQVPVPIPPLKQTNKQQKIFQPTVHTAWTASTLPSFRDYKLSWERLSITSSTTYYRKLFVVFLLITSRHNKRPNQFYNQNMHQSCY